MELTMQNQWPDFGKGTKNPNHRTFGFHDFGLGVSGFECEGRYHHRKAGGQNQNHEEKKLFHWAEFDDPKVFSRLYSICLKVSETCFFSDECGEKGSEQDGASGESGKSTPKMGNPPLKRTPFSRRFAGAKTSFCVASLPDQIPI